ncbi:MAG: hypothetical protein O7F71_04950 [Gammaproteobacteria bacterium]|nr:hypothetical protein [Gammaproteobacteria bacterium]
MNRLSVFLIGLTCWLPCSASAHEPMQNDCGAPTRPADDQNDLSWQKFLDEIDVFQACINTTVERHQAASSEHQEVARLTVGRWNRFVQQSLNAPEDFPWPPETN